MKKTLVAMAAVVATGAFAQSLTLYGVADAYIASTKAFGGVSDIAINSGGLTESRLGVSIKDSIGGGMGAFANFEQGFQLDTGAGTYARTAVVGLNGDFGTVTAGRQTTPSYDAVANFINPQSATRFSAVEAVRIGGDVPGNTAGAGSVVGNNSVRYDSPNFGGLTFGASLGLGENKTAGAKASRDVSLSATYAVGPLGVALGTTQQEVGLAANQNIKSTEIGGYYDLGVAKVNLGLNTAKDNTVPGVTDKGVSAAVSTTYGPFAVIAQVARNKATGTQNRQSLGLEAHYGLSKRTTAYVGFNNTKNKNLAAGADTARVLAVGARHKF